jgi:hypothetical protein
MPAIARASLIEIAAVAALAYALCDLLHELGHLVATLPVGIEAVSISTIGLSTRGSSALVAAAGPMANLVLAASLLVVRFSTLSPAWRFFAWLFGTVNLFDAAAYLLYSAVLGSGDWAVVFGAVAPPSIWRPGLGLAGLACYAGAVRASLHALRRLVLANVVAASNVDRYCTVCYWVGGLLLTAGAALNPISPWFVLTSGAATGFGAMLGLLALPSLLQRTRPPESPAGESLRIALPWLATGAVAMVVFIGVFGPGLRLA